MRVICFRRLSLLFMAGAVGLSTPPARAQAPGVEIVRDCKSYSGPLIDRAEELRAQTALLSLEKATNQLQRTHCSVTLPKPRTRKTLSGRQIWQRSKQAHVKVGWHYRCKKCGKWHQNLAGGYFISSDGLIATCYHLLDKDSEHYREAFLIAADDQGRVLPILEVLAANKGDDVAILRAKVETEVTALPLNPNAFPGDDAWCYSDPLGRSSYFSKGIVNRFYIYREEEDRELLRMQVSTDWAPGSSGAAVVDIYGNAIGHVSEISTAGTRVRKPRITAQPRATNKVVRVRSVPQGPMIVFHCAARAADVLALTEND